MRSDKMASVIVSKALLAINISDKKTQSVTLCVFFNQD